MTKIGFVVLAHDNIFRLRQVVNSLAEQGVPIALHLDKKTPKHKRVALEYFFRNHPRIYWVESIRCEWGEWSIVQAQINSTKLLLEKEPDLDFVYHISGSCLPLRSMEELGEFLGSTELPYDYIESVSIDDRKWVVDGLDQERIRFYHPFNWQSQRRLFDLNVKLQRALRFRRKIPSGLTPSFGSQWWCLSVSTLKKILRDPQFDEYAKFFSKSWIPDESFFQTLARKHSPRIVSRSLTYATFDSVGKPFLIYDDQLDILRRLDAFFIRKIWRGADALYMHFLSPNREVLKRDEFAGRELEALLNYARDTCNSGRPGLLSQFVRPRARGNTVSRDDYYIYVGFQCVEKQIYENYYESPLVAQMGYLFHPSRTEFDLSKHKTPKNAPDLFRLRDYDKLQFLVQRVWYAFPRKVAFLAKPHHLRKLERQLARDHHAHIIVVQGAWLFDLYERKIENLERMRTICRINMRREQALLTAIEKGENPNIHVVTLGDFLRDPSIVTPYLPETMVFGEPQFDKELFKDFVSRVSANGISLKTYKLEAYFADADSKPQWEEPRVVNLSDYVQSQKR